MPGPSEKSSREARLDPARQPAYSARMQATVNGESTELPEGLSVAALLRHLGVRAERVAVERNGAVVKRDRHAEEMLAPDDVLEIVTFVGGG
jgi:sulfur carrier protein